MNYTIKPISKERVLAASRTAQYIAANGVHLKNLDLSDSDRIYNCLDSSAEEIVLRENIRFFPIRPIGTDTLERMINLADKCFVRKGQRVYYLYHYDTNKVDILIGNR